MSRTTRNRTTVPHGWTVRDDGLPYWDGNDLYANNVFDETGHSIVPRYRRRWAQCEKASYRRAHHRAYRARVRHLMDKGRYEDIIPPRRTGGWLTW